LFKFVLRKFFDSPFQNLSHIITGEWVENVDMCPGYQRCIYLECGIFRCGAAKRDRTVFNCREKCILLAFVETVNLVDKKNRVLFEKFFPLSGIGYDFPYFFDTACNSREGDKYGIN